MKLTRELLGSVFSKTNGHCWYCGFELDPFGLWHIDHQIPQSQNGTDHIDNLVPACRSCNLRKSNRNVEQYSKYLVQRLENLITTATEFAQEIHCHSHEIVTAIELLENAASLVVTATPTFWAAHPYNNSLTPSSQSIESETLN